MFNSPITNAPLRSGNGISDGVVDQAAIGMHGAVDKAASSIEQAADAARPAIARAANMAHQTVDKVAEVAGPTAEWLNAQGASLASTQRKAAADARGYVSANPWQSLGVALAAGFLIGRLAR